MNSDGVRDDVGALIARFPITPGERTQAMGVARALRRTLLESGSDDSAVQRALETYASVAPISGSENASYVLHRVQAYTVNTPQRMEAYLAATERLGGKVLRPDASGLPEIGRGRANDLCSSTGFEVLFVNGVGNTDGDAMLSLARLRTLVGPRVGEETVACDLMYNPSAGVHRDLLEAFRQSVRERGLEDRIELLWAFISGDRGLLDLVASAVSGNNPLTGAFLDAIRDQLRGIVGSAAANVAAGNEIITDSFIGATRSHLTERKKVLLVAHSQGNWFARSVFAALRPGLAQNSLGVVHIATPTAQADGPYITSSNDYVIDGARLAAGSLPGNMTVPRNLDDFLGHSFNDIYLNPRFNARAQVSSTIGNAMAGLEAPEEGGSSGFFTVTMTWDGSGDVDLHTIEPNGTQVYYADKAGDSGFLDVDNVTANGPEHYFSSCDSTKLQTGTYRIGVNNYSGALGRTATFVLSTPERIYEPIRVDVGSVRGSAGNASPIPVLSVAVDRDSSGRFTAALVRDRSSEGAIRTNAPNIPKGR